MNFRSLADLSRDVTGGLHLLPRDIDVVVGVARSGMLPATQIALALNLPLAELRSFAEGRFLGSGITRRTRKMDLDFSQVRHALIVDDSISSGSSMVQARETLAPLADSMRLTFCAIYGSEPKHASADLTFATVPHPRVFEWNALHHDMLSKSCLDIDGVLCYDPTHADNDDGEAYLRFLLSARPRVIPSLRVAALVTSRLEKYRPQTEAWLEEHGVVYDKLVMLDLPDAETRRRLRAHGRFKGDYYRSDAKAQLFIESELDQAREIAEVSGKPVLSLEGPEMCLPGGFAFAAATQLRQSGLRRMLKRTARRVLGKTKASKAGATP